MSHRGQVVVFRPEDEGYPPGGYQQAARVTDSLVRYLGVDAMDLDSPVLFREYYRQLYDVAGVDQHQGRGKRLVDAILGLDFPEVAKLYRLIDKDAINVVVPYDPSAYGSLRHEIDDGGHLTTRWVRAARPHAVSLFRPSPDDSAWASLKQIPLAPGGHEFAADWFILLDPQAYDRDLAGLTQLRDVWLA
jgi:CRISPR-associated endonuclease/helicase Cas3